MPRAAAHPDPSRNDEPDTGSDLESSLGTSSSSSASSSSSGTEREDPGEAAAGREQRVFRWLALASEGAQGGASVVADLGVGGGLFVPSVRTRMVHITVRQRLGSKKLTVIAGLPPAQHGRSVDFARLLKAMRRLFRTSGALRADRVGNSVLQLQGDCWRVSKFFLVHQGLAEEADVHCSGLIGDGLAGLRDFAQLEELLCAEGAPAAAGLATGPVSSRPRRPRPAPQPPSPPLPASEDGREGGIHDGMHWGEVLQHFQRLERLRGRRGAEAQRVESLQRLLQVVDANIGGLFGPEEVLVVLHQLLRADLDASTGAGVARRMQPDSWHRALRLVQRLLAELVAHPVASLQMWTAGVEEGAQQATVVPEGGVGQQQKSQSHPQALDVVCEGILRLDEELCKALQLTSRWDAAYSTYLAAIVEWLGLAAAGLDIARRHRGDAASPEAERRLVARLLEAVYHLEDGVVARSVLSGHDGTEGSAQQQEEPAASSQAGFVRELCIVVCNGGDKRARARAILQQVYHHALHGRFREANDTLVLSGAASDAAQLDRSTQVLCNRALAQLGLCAFRHGRFSEARDCLQGLCAKGQAAELLGEVAVEAGDVGPFQPGGLALDSTVPYHLHIPARLIDGVHLTCVVLLDGSSLARPATLWPAGRRPNDSSVAFLERQLDLLERRTYDGPPETSRECIFAATQKLRRGEWEACAALLEEALARCGLGVASATKSTFPALRERVKEASLQAFMVSASSVYPCLELSRLAGMFDLAHRATRTIISRMMLTGELNACWDETSQLVLVQEASTHALQGMACQLVDLVATALAHNEGMLQRSPQRRPASVRPAAKSLIVPAAPGSQRRAATAGPMSRELPRSAAAGGPDAPNQGPGSGAGRPGRNSRFKRDLANLNKAAVKWLSKERRGEMMREQTLTNIGNSPAVAHLRAKHGDGFRHDAFIEEVLSHAAAASVRGPGAAAAPHQAQAV